jgi:hypothetical protein
VDIIKNAEKIYYTRNDDNELVGIDKSKSGRINIKVTDNTIEEITLFQQIDGTLSPQSKFKENESKFRGFDWRDEERPKSVEDLFKDDPPLTLPIIKGLEEYVPPDEFFDDDLLKRIDDAEDKTSDKENKAARQLPKPIQQNRTKKDSTKQPLPTKKLIKPPKKDN